MQANRVARLRDITVDLQARLDLIDRLRRDEEERHAEALQALDRQLRCARRQYRGAFNTRYRLDLHHRAPGARQRIEAGRMSKRILVIEDTENNRIILNDLLTNAGFELMMAPDAPKGVAMAAESRPDLILMDIQLPIIDGYEATRRIRSNPELRQIPIIAVTSYALSGDDAKARAAGCDGYVAKPFSPRVILAKVREFLK
jgi:two-component system, cell cycle response regulator DivK